jgi:hypothetical protein
MLQRSEEMVAEARKKEFCASVYWNGNGFQAVWAVRIGPRELMSDGLMSLSEDSARYHVRWEANRLGFNVIRWGDGSAGS